MLILSLKYMTWLQFWKLCILKFFLQVELNKNVAS